MQSFDQRTQLEGLAIVGYKYLSMSFAIRAWRHYSFPSSTGNCDFSSTWKRTSSFSSRDRHPSRTSNALLVEPLRSHHFSSVETPPGSLQCSTCKSESKWKELYIFMEGSISAQGTSKRLFPGCETKKFAFSCLHAVGKQNATLFPISQNLGRAF